MTEALQLQHAYRECARIVKRNARNFYYAFVVLPNDRRDAINAVYAFCRLVDDAADEPGPIADKTAQLVRYREHLDAAIAGGAPASLVLMAVADAVRRFAIPIHLFHELIDGVTQDLTVTRYADFAGLKRYCYLVASTVGLMCLPIFGYTDDAAVQHGIDLGLAMQITNILRDIGEDASRDRIYVPQQDMKHYGYTEQQLKDHVVNDAFRALIQQQVKRAREYYASGQQLLQYVPSRTRACPKLMHDVYKSILDKIEAADYDVFAQRLGPTKYEKWRMVGRIWKSAVLAHA